MGDGKSVYMERDKIDECPEVSGKTLPFHTFGISLSFVPASMKLKAHLGGGKKTLCSGLRKKK